jgi:hypothetical protein
MKLLALVPLVAFAGALHSAGDIRESCSHVVEHVLARPDDPPPPPVDCPFCGGNPQLHRERVKFFVQLQGSLAIWHFGGTTHWR